MVKTVTTIQSWNGTSIRDRWHIEAQRRKLHSCVRRLSVCDVIEVRHQCVDEPRTHEWSLLRTAFDASVKSVRFIVVCERTLCEHNWPVFEGGKPGGEGD